LFVSAAYLLGHESKLFASYLLFPNYGNSFCLFFRNSIEIACEIGK
jgi:hypothetical protein